MRGGRFWFGTWSVLSRRAARNCIVPITDGLKPRKKAETETADGRSNKSTELTARTIRPFPKDLKNSPALNFGSLARNHPVNIAVSASKTTRGSGRDLRKIIAGFGPEGTRYSTTMPASIAAPTTKYMRTRGAGSIVEPNQESEWPSAA